VTNGSQHVKKLPPQQTKPPSQRTRAEIRRMQRADDAGMFFPKLRRQAKWVFVLLALVFGGGFVLFGVGSGSSGMGDILSNWLSIGQASGGPSASKLEEKTREEPQNAEAWRELATAYQTDQRSADAARALERYTELRPKDTDALQELGGQYQRQLSDLSVEFQSIQLGSPVADASSFRPPPATPFGKLYADPGALQDPLAQSLQSEIGAKASELQVRATGIQAKLLETNRKVVRLDPNNPTAQFQLAQVADGTGDTKTAAAAYRKFLELSPDDPLAAQVKQRLEQLTPPASSASG
jgi:tetratricopeptide (TPR) repeat protein